MEHSMLIVQDVGVIIRSVDQQAIRLRIGLDCASIMFGINLQQ